MKKTYDAVIIGAGVQGLSLAYNLARKGLKKIVVFDKSHIGSGASSRNGEMIRSAFGCEEWIRFFNTSLRLWETLSGELDFNVMFTRCGYAVLAATSTEMKTFRGFVELQKSFGLDTRLMDRNEVVQRIPALNPKTAAGALFQTGGGYARHDAVIWAYERAARLLRVEIRPFTEVINVIVENNEVTGIKTATEHIATRTVVNAAGGHAGRIAAMVNVELPTQVYRLEMLATEPLKPFLPFALSSPHTLSYMHQTTRGEFVGGAETAHMQPVKSLRSSGEALQDMASKFIGLFPGLGGVKLMRQWAGIVDMAPDASPVLGPVPGIEGFILDCGWVYGFMGAPAAGAHLADYILTGKTPADIRPFSFSRFAEGKLIQDSSLAVPTETVEDGECHEK